MTSDGTLTGRGVISWFELRAADVAVAISLLLVVGTPGQTGPSPMWTPEPPGWTAFIPLIGMAMALTGNIWMRLIARGTPEPEANDRHWWSRA